MDFGGCYEFLLGVRGYGVLGWGILPSPLISFACLYVFRQMNGFLRFLSALPLPASGVMLAVASLGILFPQFFGAAVPFPEAGMVLHALCGTVSAVLWILLILKTVFFFPQITSAFCDPIPASVAGTFPMGTMALSVYLAEIAGSAAVLLWYAGIFLHAALIVFFSLRFLRHPKLSQMVPSWLVVYVGIVLAAITAPYFNQLLAGQIIFWFGAVLVVPLTIVLLIRCKKMPLAEPARPLICIFAAPVSIILAGYLQSFTANAGIVFAFLLLETAVLALVLLKLPSLLRLPFYPSYAAFTFPFVVTATAYLFGVELLVESGLLSVGWYAVPALVILLASVLICYVAVRYALFLRQAVTG